MATMESEAIYIRIMANRGIIRTALRVLSKKAEAAKKSDEDLDLDVEQHDETIAVCRELIDALKDQRDLMLEGTPMGEALTAEHFKSGDGQSLEAGPLAELLVSVDIAADASVVSAWTLAMREEAYDYVKRRQSAIKDKRKKVPPRPQMIPAAWLPAIESALNAPDSKTPDAPTAVEPPTGETTNAPDAAASSTPPAQDPSVAGTITPKKNGKKKGETPATSPAFAAACAWVCISCRSTNNAERISCGNCGEPRSPSSPVLNEKGALIVSEDPAPTKSTPEHPEKSLAGQDESEQKANDRGETPPAHTPPVEPPAPAPSGEIDLMEALKGSLAAGEVKKEAANLQAQTDEYLADMETISREVPVPSEGLTVAIGDRVYAFTDGDWVRTEASAHAPAETMPPAPASNAPASDDKLGGPWGVRPYTPEGSTRPSDEWEVIRKNPETDDVEETLPRVFSDIDLALEKAKLLNRKRAEARGQEGA